MVGKSIHIGFGDSAAACIQEAIVNFGLKGDEVIPSRDDFTQGPISNCLIESGLSERMEYWRHVNRMLEVEMDVPQFYKQSISLLDNLDAQEVTIWPGDSCHDILATGWLIAYLEHKNLKWFIVNLAAVDQDDYPGEQAAVNLAIYTPDQLLSLCRYQRPITREDKQFFASRWQKASEENSHYRIKSGNEIISVDEDYFDEYIMTNIRKEYEPTTQVIRRILIDGEHRLSDTTVEWNIRKMIERNIVEYQGVLTSMKTYSIRINKS
ncbi:MAG: DUF3658 domain-containing protein [Saprospiraceae bacterium]|nr:DUF3658 domain-containing protein [Saprospiraceae bacterium]